MTGAPTSMYLFLFLVCSLVLFKYSFKYQGFVDIFIKLKKVFYIIRLVPKYDKVRTHSKLR